MFSTTLRTRGFRLKIPTAAIEPIKVDATEETTAMTTVFLRLSQSLAGADVNSDLYASRVNPSGNVKLVVFEKENTITITIGAYIIASIRKI